MNELKVGDTVKVRRVPQYLRQFGEVGVVIRTGVYHEVLKVDVILVRIGERGLWFTSYELEKIEDNDSERYVSEDNV